MDDEGVSHDGRGDVLLFNAGLRTVTSGFRFGSGFGAPELATPDGSHVVGVDTLNLVRDI